MPTRDMVWIPGGNFRMGSDRHYPEEAPAHMAEVGGFWIDRTPVTHAAFAAFVTATGYRTVAEIVPDPSDYPDAVPALLVAGATVFSPPANRQEMRFWGDWWRFVPGACWRRPHGVDADIEPALPVVQIAHADATAYATWAGKALPTEVEWEYASRGGSRDTEFAWGDALAPGGKVMANTWSGLFPFEVDMTTGVAGPSPVGSFPENGYGLFDMIGNVWEWTADTWTARHDPVASPCCGAVASGRAAPQGIERKIIKGGSHLCAPNYCQRYRPPARQPQAVDSGTSHIGFRCASRRGVA